MSRIAIVGGHGKIALILARMLVDDGHQVTSLIRKPEQSDDITGTGAVPAIIDIEHASTEEIISAFEGHDAIVFAAGAGGGDADRTFAVDRDAAIRCVDAASATSIKRFALVSYFGASVDHGVSPDNSFYSYAEAKADADQYLRASDLDWTIIAPSSLGDGGAVGTILTREGGADGKAETGRALVAEVIVAALATPATVGRMIEFTEGDTPIDEALAAN